jgi:signal transduction histidine kinase
MAEVVRLADAYYDHLYQAISRREQGAPASEWVDETEPAWEALEAALTHATALEVRDLADARRRAGEQTSSAFNLIFGGTALAVAVGILMTLLIVRTLTALQRSRGEQEITMSLLAERNRDLDAFAGRVAHDLRNVLAPLPIAAATLREVRASPDQVDVVTERVSRVGVRATAFLETLLAFARSGRSAADPYTGAPVRAAVADALDMLAGVREEAGAEVEVDVDDLEVVCAPALLQTVMTNLLSNAFKFLAGRPQPRVRVAARVREGACQVTVEDNGPGIDPEHLPRIFEPFYRTPGNRMPGSGLGLATVHRIVEATGGSISVWSQPGQGTRFTLNLPAAPRPNTPAPDPRARQRLPGSTPSLAPS